MEQRVFTNVSRRTLSEQVAQQLMDFIFSRGMKPGEPLPSENALASDFGVSRPVIREALKSLAGQGIIEIISGKGALIKDVDPKTLRLFFRRALQTGHTAAIELWEVRKPLEVQSAVLAAQRRTEADLTRMTETVSKMARHLFDLEPHVELDSTYHMQIASAAKNTLLFYLIGSIRDSARNARLEARVQRTSKQIEHIHAEHEEILAAIRDQDADRAKAAMTRHLEAWLFLPDDGLPAAGGR